MNEVTAGTDNMQLLFWVCTLVTGLMGIYAFHRRHRPWAIPSMTVIGTAFTWYLIDILYSGMDSITAEFSQPVIDRALAQVILFIVSYGLMVAEVTRWFVRNPPSLMWDTNQSGAFNSQNAQDQIERSLWFITACWIALFGFAQIYYGYPVMASLYPPLAGYRFELWSRDRLGGSIDYVLSAFKYTHLFLCSIFGAILVLSHRMGSRLLAAVMILISWPYWFFGRARNPVLVIGVPAAAGYLIFFKQRTVVKIAVTLVMFFTVNAWFKLVIATRNEGVTQGFMEVVSGELNTSTLKVQKHRGLNMFEELCYINRFIEDGSYKVNWGKRYFAEAVNFIPRAIWPDKPLLGIDYAIARGARRTGGRELVNVTISTGMIGQGVVNFGYIMGPVAAAFLMALWTGILAKFWSEQRQSILRACLFLVGLGLTFNAGRNITLLVFFPFVFGYMLVRIFEIFEERHIQLNAARPSP